MASDFSARIAVNNLAPEHLLAFTQTLNRIVLSNLTTEVFAQIAAGKPISKPFPSGAEGTPSDPVKPDPESVRTVNAFQDRFRPELLHVDANIAQAYQNTTVGSRDFKLRLLEIVAAAFHSTAAFFSKETDNNIAPHASSPTPFYHIDYRNHDQYPLGISDMVGYWAEYKVFGGVVLFDRGQSERDALDGYIHPTAFYMIFKLSDYQLDQFIDFGLNPTTKQSSSSSSNESQSLFPLPFRAEKYAQRINPDESMVKYHIFRNKYERKPIDWSKMRPSYQRKTRLEDFPDMMDFLEKINKERDQRE